MAEKEKKPPTQFHDALIVSEMVKLLMNANGSKNPCAGAVIDEN